MIWSVQLVFDARDPDEVMLFWGRFLEYGAAEPLTREGLQEFRREHPQFHGRGRIDDTLGRRPPVYIQRVPEPKSGRNRVRLEVAVPPDELGRAAEHATALGATATDDGYQDPEGNEFHLIEGPPDRMLRTIVIDALDPERLLQFWTQALGYEAQHNRCDPPPGAARVEGGWIVVNGERIGQVGPESASPDRGILDLVPGLAFIHSDEPKRIKNRLHLDLNSTDVDADLDRLRDHGARVVRWDTDHVMQDPEGNEFCLQGPRRLLGLMA